MTRLQEFQWAEKVSIDKRADQPLKWSPHSRRINLYRLPWLHNIIESRWPQLILRVLALSGFAFTIAGGLFGSRVGSHNFAIIIVWIAWWTALKLLFIPFGGRSWCSICPIPMPGDWLQQGGIIEPGRRKIGLNLRWPKRLRGTWMQSGSFLLIGMFSAITLTDPKVTGWVLLAIFGLAIGLGLLFEHRAFCTYLCPIGGFSGMYAQASPVEVRMIDKQVCACHEVKSCYQACPWGLYPVAFRNNLACGLCMECLRACPEDNLALNLRPFGTDFGSQKQAKLDETFLALVMLGSVMSFSAVFTGPWGWLKSAAYEIGSLPWVGYSAGYLALNLVLLPLTFFLAVWLGKQYTHQKTSLRQSIATQSQVLLPLGLMAWLAFTVSFAFPKLNLITSVMNDPFGWGWNLLRPITLSSMPDLTSFSVYIQVLLLISGMFWSARISRKLTLADGYRQHRHNLPILGFGLIFTSAMFWLLIG